MNEELWAQRHLVEQRAAMRMVDRANERADAAEALADELAGMLKEVRSALARERGGGSPLSRAAYVDLHEASRQALARHAAAREERP